MNICACVQKITQGDWICFQKIIITKLSSRSIAAALIITNMKSMKTALAIMTMKNMRDVAVITSMKIMKNMENADVHTRMRKARRVVTVITMNMMKMKDADAIIITATNIVMEMRIVTAAPAADMSTIMNTR